MHEVTMTDRLAWPGDGVMARRRKQPGSGTVLERPSAEHGSVFQIRWRINGGPARYETIGPDRKEADQALALRLAEINRGQHREHREATFLEFASEWFANHRAHLKPSTVVDYRLTLERHLLPYFGEYLVSQISTELIERYVADKARERQDGDRRVEQLEAELARREDAGEPVHGVRRRLYAAKQDRGLCNRSINKTVERFKQVLATAVKHGYIDRNPVDAVTRLKARKRTRPYLQLDQVDPLLGAHEAGGPAAGRDVAARRSAIGGGARAALAGRRPARRPAADDDHPQRLPGPGGRGEDRRGGVGVVRAEAARHAARPQGAQPRTAADDDLVFCTGKGGYVNPSNVRQRILAPAIARANEQLDARRGAADPGRHAARAEVHVLLAADRAGRGRGDRGGADAPRRPDDHAAGVHAGDEAHPAWRRRTSR